MRKILLLLSLVVVMAVFMASSSREQKMVGRVSAINTAAVQFTVVNPDNVSYVFASTPSTEFEWDNRLRDNARFSDLRVGMWVKVEFIPGQNVHTATEVDLFRE